MRTENREIAGQMGLAVGNSEELILLVEHTNAYSVYGKT